VESGGSLKGAPETGFNRLTVRVYEIGSGVGRAWARGGVRISELGKHDDTMASSPR